MTDTFFIISDESRRKMNFMMSMLAHTQSKRLDEQRVCLSSLPGLRMDNPSTTERGTELCYLALFSYFENFCIIMRVQIIRLIIIFLAHTNK